MGHLVVRSLAKLPKSPEKEQMRNALKCLPFQQFWRIRRPEIAALPHMFTSMRKPMFFISYVGNGTK